MRSVFHVRTSAAAFLALLVLGLGLPDRASADYSFTLIADNRGPLTFVGYGPPVINASGTVAFESRLGPLINSTKGIFTGTGAVPNVLATIADTTGSFSNLSGVSINASGTVAFGASLDAGGRGIFTGTGDVLNATRTIADTSGVFTSVSVSPSINDAGLVAFLAAFSGGSGIFTGSGAVPNVTSTIVDSAGLFSAFSETTPINAAGTVAFTAQLDDGRRGVYAADGTVPNVTRTIAERSGPVGAFGSSPALNAAGTVLFDVFEQDVGRLDLFTGTASGNVLVANTDGPFANFGSDYAINAAGKVVFFATSDAGTDGIYTGADAVADKVIESGDSLFGRTVTFVDVGLDGINDAGQIAFYFELDDGTRGMARAEPFAVPVTPIPEPETLALFSLGLACVAVARRRRNGWRVADRPAAKPT